MRTKKPIIQRIMDEHIELPGFPQIVVRRGWAYQFFKSLGWSESDRGFGSLDYSIFAKAVTSRELTPDADREAWLNEEVRETFRR